MTNREYITRRLVDPAGATTIWGHSILEAYSTVARLGFLPSLRYCRQSHWLILGSRIFNQLNPQIRSNAHLVMSARDPVRLSKWPHSWSYDLKAYSELKRLVEGDKLGEATHLPCWRRVSEIIDRTRAEALVANSTIDPINRLWLGAAKSAGLKTVCVQHGVYSRHVPGYVLEEDIVNHYISLDDNQSSIISRNIPSEKITALGSRSFFEWNPPKQPPKICFVGEDWERYGYRDLKSEIISTYKKIIRRLQPQPFGHIYYKPHPSEQMFFDIMKFTSPLKAKDIDIPDVYIGFSSTFLKEMCSKGKLVIQILDDRTRSEDFEKFGYCLSRPNDDHLPEVLCNLFQSSQQVPFIKDAELSEVLLGHA
jgi:hypothetical protein